LTNPFDFVEEWSGDLRKIEFPVPKPMLPSAAVTFLHFAGLPKSLGVLSYQQIQFDFLLTAINLAGVWQKEMKDFSFPSSWARFWQIGSITYTQAAAWLCIEELTGRIVAVDVDIDDPVYVVNDSILGMMRCMKLLRDWVRLTDGSLTQATSFTDAISRDPALSLGDAKYFRLPIVEAAIDAGCDKVAVSCE
jgi:hypothetical protein